MGKSKGGASQQAKVLFLNAMNRPIWPPVFSTYRCRERSCHSPVVKKKGGNTVYFPCKHHGRTCQQRMKSKRNVAEKELQNIVERTYHAPHGVRLVQHVYNMTLVLALVNIVGQTGKHIYVLILRFDSAGGFKRQFCVHAHSRTTRKVVGLREYGVVGRVRTMVLCWN